MDNNTPNRSLIAQVMLSPDERRPRAGWRIALWFVMLILFSMLAILALQLVAWVTGVPFGQDISAMQWGTQIGSVIAITASVFLARRVFDRRSITSLGLKPDLQALKDLLAGILIAAVMMFFIFFFFRISGMMTILGFAWDAEATGNILLNLGIMLVIFIIVGWQEELFARGYLMQNLADGLSFAGLRWAMAIAVLASSLIFGAGHLGNPNATWIGALGTGLAGVFLAYGYLASNSLWLPIGLHIGWNFFEGPILGFRVSGMGGFYRLIDQAVSGPEWLTGGAYGPEAGLILLPALALGTALIWLYTRPVQPHLALQPGARAAGGRSAASPGKPSGSKGK